MTDITQFDFIENQDKRTAHNGYAVFLQKKDFQKIPIYNIIVKKDGGTGQHPNPLKSCYAGLLQMLTPTPSPFILKVCGYNEKYTFVIKRINKGLDRYGIRGFDRVNDQQTEQGAKQSFYLLIENDEEKERLFKFLNER